MFAKCHVTTIRAHIRAGIRGCSLRRQTRQYFLTAVASSANRNPAMSIQTGVAFKVRVECDVERIFIPGFPFVNDFRVRQNQGRGCFGSQFGGHTNPGRFLDRLQRFESLPDTTASALGARG